MSRLSPYPSYSAPSSRRASNYTTHGEDFDSRFEDEPSSLAPALSIGAISAITGVSCFTDNERTDDDDDGTDTGQGLKTEPVSLISGPSSPAIDNDNAPRAQSEPMREGTPECPQLANHNRGIAPAGTAGGTRRQRLRRRRPRRAKLGRPDQLNYDAVAAAMKMHAAGPPNTASTPTSRILRKVRTGAL